MSDKLQGGIKAGSTGVILPFQLRTASDSTVATGVANTDLTRISYWRVGTSTQATSASPSAGTLGSHPGATSWSWVEVSSTNHPGLYQVCLPDAAFASGADGVVVTVVSAGEFTESHFYPITTNVVQGGDSFARLGSPTGASVSADNYGILTEVQGLADLDAAGVRTALGMASADLDTQLEILTNGTHGLPALKALIDALNDLASGDVQTAVATVLAAYDPPTKTELDAAVAPLSTHDAAAVVSAMQAAADDFKADVSSLATAAALTTVAGNVSAILADTGTDGVVISTATARAIADAILARGADNVEDSAGVLTLAGVILATFEAAISGTTMTIKKSDGSTTFATRTLTTDADAEPIVGIT